MKVAMLSPTAAGKAASSAIIAGGLAVAAPACSANHVANYTEQDAQVGAQLRATAKGVFVALYHPCGSDGFGPVRARFEALRSTLASPQNVIDLAVVEADYNYEMSLVDIACPELNAAEKRDYEALQIAVAEQMITRVETLLSPASGD